MANNLGYVRVVHSRILLHNFSVVMLAVEDESCKRQI